MMETQVLEEIKMELKELRRLYQTLVDKLVPVGEATKEEVEAIESSDVYADEDELLRALE
jgi:archaellum component FlaC